MGEVRFMISEAAKQVQVESHVLRYWEEELNLKIGRTEMGHRYYTEDDIQLFRCIKKLKNEGMLLRDLKPLIPELRATRKILTSARNDAAARPEAGRSDAARFETSRSDTARLETSGPETGRSQVSRPEAGGPDVSRAEAAKSAPSGPEPARSETGKSEAKTSIKVSDTHAHPAAETSISSPKNADKPEELAIAQAEVIPVTQLEQVRSLIGDVLTEVVTANNTSLEKNISRKVTSDVIREMDFMFQAKERQEEEHYRKLDCLIRQQQANRREASKLNPLGKLKKILT